MTLIDVDIGLTLPAVAVTPVLPAELAPDLEHASNYARAEKATTTRRAYGSDFAIFSAWCAERHTSSLPACPETVAAFVAWEAQRGSRASTIGRRCASIKYAHKLAGHPIPTDDERVRATVRGIRRAVGTAPVKKAPATADKVIAMAAATLNSRHGKQRTSLGTPHGRSVAGPRPVAGKAARGRPGALPILESQNVRARDAGITGVSKIRRSKSMEYDSFPDDSPQCSPPSKR
jgi:hypothetical protein